MKQEKPCQLAIPPKNARSAGQSDIQADAPPMMNELALRMQEDIELKEHAEALEAEFNSRPKIGTFSNDDELAIWYLGKVNDLDSQIERIKEQAGALIRAAENRKRGLAWKWGGAFKEIIDAKLRSQGGKKRSVDLLTGRAGYRKQAEKLTIIDPAKVLEWADFNCPQAIKRECRITPLKDHFAETGEIPPGVHLTEARDTFYPPVTSYELAHQPQPELKGT